MLKRLLACAAIALVSIPLHAQAPAAARAEAGWQALQAGDGDRAATAFREALIQNPRDPTLHFGAGVAAHLLGHETDATESLRRALQLEPRLIGVVVLVLLSPPRAGGPPVLPPPLPCPLFAANCGQSGLMCPSFPHS